MLSTHNAHKRSQNIDFQHLRHFPGGCRAAHERTQTGYLLIAQSHHALWRIQFSRGGARTAISWQLAAAALAHHLI